MDLLESDEKVIKLMSKSCPLHLLLCGRYCSFHTPIRKVRFNLEEKIVRQFGEFSCTLLSLNIPLAMVYNVSVTRTKEKITKLQSATQKRYYPLQLLLCSAIKRSL